VQQGLLRQIEHTLIALILAASPKTRWQGPEPKQLALVAGTPVITRTVRQLNEREIKNIVVTHDPEIERVVDATFKPEKRRWWSETLLSTQSLWDGDVAVLNGDVVFSEKALDRILSGGLHVYGQRRPKWEAFAASFGRDDYKKVLQAARKAVQWGESGQRCLIWEFYRALCGFDLAHQHRFDDKIWVEINDYTTDFDILERYRDFLEREPWARSRTSA
jgi:hypothetical protein